MSEAHHERATYESPHLDSAVAIFALLAHPVRVKIVLALRDIEMSTNHLADVVDLPVEQVGEDLAALESAGIVTRDHEACRHFYRLANEHAGSLAANAIFHAEHQTDSEANIPTS